MLLGVSLDLFPTNVASITSFANLLSSVQTTCPTHCNIIIPIIVSSRFYINLSLFITNFAYDHKLTFTNTIHEIIYLLYYVVIYGCCTGSVVILTTSNAKLKSTCILELTKLKVRVLIRVLVTLSICIMSQ